MLDKTLQNVAVIGAAGKMGSGISLLILQEMARAAAEKNGGAAGAGRLLLIDSNDAALAGLLSFLRAQMIKAAEKSIVPLRHYYRENKGLVENSDVIAAFVEEALSNVRVDTDIRKAAGANLVFEAIIEDAAVKGGLLKKLNAICGKKTFFLTNTSSIPISALGKKAGLGGRLIGCHFYNPPAVQRLVEVIAPPRTNKRLETMVYGLGKRLKKILVPSNDVSGFIGNGHFMRDALYAMRLAEEIQKDRKPYESVYMVNAVSQDFMVRPMGIFQLMDYVGIDVCQLILTTMRTFNRDKTLHSPLIDKMMKLKVRGGQFANGTQKDGFLKYERNRPVGVYCTRQKKYVMMGQGDWAVRCNEALGPLPATHQPWKALLTDPQKDGKLAAYFKQLFGETTPGADLAQKYLLQSREIGRGLVKDRIAKKIEDVNTVLMNGFYHLYGPENPYL